MVPQPPPAEAPDPQLTPEAVSATLAELVKIDSVNPAYGGPAGGEARVIAWVREFLAGLGVRCETWDALPGRPNLLAEIPGADPARSVLYNTHVDVVSASGMTIPPFAAEIRGGRLWGRGATDAKAQVAAMLHAVASIARLGRPPAAGVKLLLTVDEESGFEGIRSAVARGVRADAAVVGEPTCLEVVAAHKGTQRWAIEISGRAAHSAKPHLGVNAIHHAACLVRRIQEDYARELAGRGHPLLGSPTVNVSKIEGGVQINIIPPRAEIWIDRRTLPGETRAAVHAEFERLIEAVRRDLPEFRARQLEPMLVDPPLEVALDHPIVRLACETAARHGRPSKPGGVPYGTDGSKLSEAGIPTIVVGPGSIDQAHTTDEWMDLEELAAGARFFRDLMSARAPWA